MASSERGGIADPDDGNEDRRRRVGWWLNWGREAAVRRSGGTGREDGEREAAVVTCLLVLDREGELGLVRLSQQRRGRHARVELRPQQPTRHDVVRQNLGTLPTGDTQRHT